MFFSYRPGPKQIFLHAEATNNDLCTIANVMNDAVRCQALWSDIQFIDQYQSLPSAAPRVFCGLWY